MIKKIINTCFYVSMLCNVVYAMDKQPLQQEWDGERYHQSSPNHLEKALKVLGLLYPDGFGKFRTILDVGCGTGRLAAYFVKLPHNPVVYGVDASKSQIDFAKHTFGSTQNLYFQAVKAEEMDFPNIAFDFIVTIAAMHWMPDHEAVINKMVKHLNVGGEIAIAACRQPEHDHPLLEAFRYAGMQPEFKDFNFSDMRSLYYPVDQKHIIDICKKYNLYVYSPMTLVVPFDFKTREAFGDFIKGWAGGLKIPDKIRSAFMDVVIARYINTQEQADGTIHYTTPALILRACKRDNVF